MNGQINVVEKWIVFVFPFLALVFFWKMKINEPKLYFELVQEDQLLEQMQFLFYLVASLIALRVAWLFRTAGITLHAVLYFGLFAVLLLVAFEEISWGQRIFGIESPQYFVEHNLQKELNLHNLVVSAGALQKGLSFAWPVRLLRLAGACRQQVGTHAYTEIRLPALVYQQLVLPSPAGVRPVRIPDLDPIAVVPAGVDERPDLA